MLINYNLEKLEHVLEDFHLATGSAIALLDTDFNTIVRCDNKSNSFCELIHTSKTGERRCQESDSCIIKKCAQSRKLEMHICHAGLMDTAVPINYNDSVAGYIILGQMRQNTNFSDIYSRISDLDIDFKSAKTAYESLPVSTEERIISVSNTAVMLTQYILFKNMIIHQQNQHLSDAIMYISSNINKNLSVINICKSLNISKNVLYNVFHKCLNCTVGEYINNQRIEYAKTLLKTSNKTVLEISEYVGFSNHTYFCKMFKKITGTTPHKYRKANTVE